MAGAQYNHEGEIINWLNDTGTAVVSGQLVLIPSQQVAVATVDIADAASGSVRVCGVHTMINASVAIVADDPIYVTLGVTPAATNVPTTSNYFFGWAERSADSATTVKVRLAPFCESPNQGVAGLGTHSVSSASAVTLTVATHFRNRAVCAVIASAAGTQAIATPALAEIIPQGALLFVKKTGSAGAVTITAGTGTTIVGGATVADQDAQNDLSLYMFVGTEWLRVSSVIA